MYCLTIVFADDPELIEYEFTDYATALHQCRRLQDDYVEHACLLDENDTVLWDHIDGEHTDECWLDGTS